MSDAESLFRKEVVQNQQARLTGEILLAQPVAFKVVTAAILVFLAVLLVFLVLGEYTRKEKAFGVVAARAGTVRLVAPEAAVVRSRPVSEGQAVKAGDLLFELDMSRHSDLGDTQRLLETALQAQRERLTTEIDEKGSLSREAADALRQKAERQKRELDHLDVEISLQESQVEASRRLADNLRPLFEERIVSEAQYQQQVAVHLDHKSRLESLRRARLSLAGEVQQASSQLRQEALRARSDKAALERGLFANEQDMIQRHGSRLAQLRASRDGTVTALLANEGQSVESGASLATLVPSDGDIEVYLFAPSSAVGFIKPGQKVNLRYEAFPYQKFGLQEGVVSEVVATDIPGRDLLVRFPQLADKGTAFFRVTVRPNLPYVEGYGQRFSLRPGMTLQADIQIERKRIIEWMFDPLLAMGRGL